MEGTNDEVRKNIGKLYKMGNYMQCNQKIKDFISKLTKENQNDMYNLWYCYYTLARCLYKEGKHELALKWIQYALRYAEDEFNRYYTMWFEACIYEALNDITRAINGYERCIKHYANQDNDLATELVLKLKCNIAILKKQADVAESILLKLESLNVDRSELQEEYKKLYGLHIANNDLLLAKKVLNKIADEEIKKNLMMDFPFKIVG